MNDDFEAIFDGADSEPVVPQIEEPTHEVEAGEAPAHPVEVEAPADPETSVEEKHGGHNVPLATFLDMRDKHKAEKAEADTLRQRLADYERAQREAQQSPLPDPSVDPRGYADMRFAAVEQQMFNQKLQICGSFAVRQHGETTVSSAAQWAEGKMKADPAFAQSFTLADNPVEFIIKQHEAATRLDEMQRDPVAYARRIAEEQGWLAAPASAATPATTQPKGKKPTSLIDIPAASGNANVQSMTEDFNSLFDNR